MRMRFILLVSFILTGNLYSEKISVYHTSDVHGMYYSRIDKSTGKKQGGFAALYSLIKKDSDYILLDSGDLFQGSPEGNFTKGLASVRYMNELGYTASCIGNHDYDYGEENLKELARAARFPFLSGNIYYKEDGKNVDYAKPWIIITKNNKKIAILGIAGEHTKHTTLPLNVKHLIFKDENEQTQKYMEEINKEKPDAIIILAHVGISPELSQKIVDVSTYQFTTTDHTTLGIARAAKNATIVFGGHNHTGLLKGYKDPQTQTMICESYWGLSYVTKAVLDFDDKTGKLRDVSCELLPLDVEKIGEDKKILDITSEISSQTAAKMDVVIGKSLVDINFESNSFDKPIGNFVSDITREKAMADIAVQNAGGVRNIISKGDIKLKDVYQVMPFENTIVKVKMKGSLIYELIKNNLKPSGSSLYISGIKVKYRIRNNKVEDVVIEKDGKEIDKDKEYILATNNYLTSGGSGGKVFTGIDNKDIEDTMISVRDALIEWIKNKKVITSIPQGDRFVAME